MVWQSHVLGKRLDLCLLSSGSCVCSDSVFAGRVPLSMRGNTSGELLCLICPGEENL